jgi:hypothetical protein
MSTRILLGGKGRPARKADNLTAICEPIVKKMWEPRRLTNIWAFTASFTRIALPSFYFHFFLETRFVVRLVYFYSAAVIIIPSFASLDARDGIFSPSQMPLSSDSPVFVIFS